MCRKQITNLLVLLAACALFAAPGWSGGVAFISAEGGTYLAERDVSTPEAAVKALLEGPTKEELLKGVSSAIPKGTKLISLDVLDNGAVINLSAKAAEGFDDAINEEIFTQALWTMRQFGLEEQVRILIDGKEITEYLPPQSPALYAAPADGQKAKTGIELGDVGLSGKRITVCPGHGWYWNGSGWYLERGINCGFEQEDLRNLYTCRYLKAHLEGDSAYVQMTRETDLNRGTGPSGHPYWQEGAYIWLRDQAYACTIWAYSSGRCSDIVGGTRLSDSINSKPRASNLDSRGNTDLLVDLHTNAFTGNCYGTGCPSGTDGFYTNDLGHEAWGPQSISLAQWIQDGHISAAQAAGFSYGHHGSTGALYGNFASTRTAQRPAALIEMGFHDSCDTDAPKLADPFFQDVGAWGVYSGICGYYGNTPTYGLYASEYVSDTIPAQMTPGQVLNVQITFKNRSVQWDEAHWFRLGGMNDSDPFAAPRQAISGTVYNGDQYTWNVTFTAPSTPGTYTTDWQMLRDAFAWFGASVSKQVQVVAPATNTPTNTPIPPTSTPTNTPVPPTSTPTNTPTRTPTNTPAPATNTPTNTPSVPTFIVDNVDAGYSEVMGSSSWFGASSSTDKYGADYRYNTTGTGLDYATWQVTIAAAGNYDVSVWYPQGSNRPTNAPYTVYYTGGSQTFPINQTTGGGQWILLGSFPFQAGGFSVVETDNADAGKALQADAVKWQWSTVQPTNTPTRTPTATPTRTPTRTPVPAIIIDDGDASYTQGSTWTYSTTTSGCLNNDYYWASTYTATYNRWAKWTPSIPVTGNYAVYAMWKSGSNRATDSPYTVNYNGGSQTVDKNQSATGGSWQLLGTYNFAAGTSGWIELRDGPAVGSKVVIADGIKLVHQP